MCWDCCPNCAIDTSPLKRGDVNLPLNDFKKLKKKINNYAYQLKILFNPDPAKQALQLTFFYEKREMVTSNLNIAQVKSQILNT